MNSKRITYTAPVLAVAALAFASALPALGNGHALRPLSTQQGAQLVEFIAPGASARASAKCSPACGTVALASNATGTIAGGFSDDRNVEHGFLRQPNGAVVIFDVRGAALQAGLDEGTIAYSVNSLGAVAGRYKDSDGIAHGFVRNERGDIKVFNVPQPGAGALRGTVAQSINDAGTVAGNYIAADGATNGFVRSLDGALQTFAVPGAKGTVVCAGRCINQEGAVTGTYYDAALTPHCFVRAANPNGAAQPFKRINLGPSGVRLATQCTSINREGAVIGYLTEPNGTYRAFVSGGSGVTIFDAPGSGASTGGTKALSIDDAGNIAGVYIDAHGKSHGFSRTANGAIKSFDARNGGAGAGEGTIVATNDAFGDIAGSVVDASGVARGFVWMP